MPDGRALWLPDYLAKWGVPFMRLPGWETRGLPGLDAGGHVRHHDASARGSDLGFLEGVIHGRPGLRNALSNLFQPRGLTPFGRAVRVVASGVCWHAGAGAWRGLTGNHRFIGTEGANRGDGEPWTPWQMDTWPLLDAAVLDGLRREESWGCEHWEYALGRKIDRLRALIDPGWHRQVVGRLLRRGPGPIVIDEEDEDMEGSSGMVFPGGRAAGRLPVVGGGTGVTAALLCLSVDETPVRLRVAFIHKDGSARVADDVTIDARREATFHLLPGEHLARFDHLSGMAVVAWDTPILARRR